MAKAVFLDRDGTIIHDAGYLADPDGVRIIPEALVALRKFRDSGFMLIITTNQSGIGRGFFSEAEMKAVNDRMASLFEQEGIFFEDILVCPHAPEENCDCRKPSPKLLLDAAERHDIDLAASAMIGDKITDAETGVAAGCGCNIFINPSPAGLVEGSIHVVHDILEATSIVLSR